LLNSDVDLAFKQEEEDEGEGGGGSSGVASGSSDLQSRHGVGTGADDGAGVGGAPAEPICPNTGERCTSKDSDWRPTLEYLAAAGIPTIITEPYKVQGDAVCRILQDSLQFGMTLPLQPNPYAGLVPNRVADPLGAAGARLWYANQFVAAFQGGWDGGGGKKRKPAAANNGDGSGDDDGDDDGESSGGLLDVYDLYCNGIAHLSMA